MELTPDEKKRIYEEEKTRIEAQGKVKAEKTFKSCGGCLGVVIGIIVVIFVLVLIGVLLNSGNKKEKTSTSQTTINLTPSVSFTGTQFVIINKDDFDWTNVKLEVNSGILKGGFVLKTQRMIAGETYTVGALQFAKGDGTRLNPISTKPQNLSIWCDTPKGKGFWYGGWD